MLLIPLISIATQLAGKESKVIKPSVKAIVAHESHYEV